MLHNVKAQHLILSSSLRVTEEDSTATTMDALKARIRELERQILRGDRYKCLICMVSISFTASMSVRVPFVRRQKPADFVYRSADYRNASVSASSYISTWFSLLCSCLMNKALLPTNQDPPYSSLLGQLLDIGLTTPMLPVRPFFLLHLGQNCCTLRCGSWYQKCSIQYLWHCRKKSTAIFVLSKEASVPMTSLVSAN